MTAKTAEPDGKALVSRDGGLGDGGAQEAGKRVRKAFTYNILVAGVISAQGDDTHAVAADGAASRRG